MKNYLFYNTKKLLLILILIMIIYFFNIEIFKIILNDSTITTQQSKIITEDNDIFNLYINENSI